MKTSTSQFDLMITFMEQHGDLNKTTSNARGRISNIRRWEELAQLLNSDGSADTKTTEKWRKMSTRQLGLSLALLGKLPLSVPVEDPFALKARRRLRPAQTEQATQHFLRAEERWREFKRIQHNDYMNIKREKDRIREVELQTQKEWQAGLRILDI